MGKFFSRYKKVILGILFTLACIIVWRVGVHIQLPFVQYSSATSDATNIFGFLDVFTGGALSQFSIVALGINPYITASIIVELLEMDIIPQFAEWKDEGEEGKAKLNKWTRYIALFLAFVQGLALIISYRVSYGYTYFQYIPNTH